MKFDTRDRITQDGYAKELLKVINKIGIKNSDLMIALKGANKEYLFATGDEVIIAKIGYMTGHTFGYNVFRMPYQNISSVLVNFHFRTGYFEIAGGGVPSRPMSYWSQGPDNAAKAPNCISLSDKNLEEAFSEAATIINKYVTESHQQPVQTSQAGPVDEIRRYKQLLDDGIITQEEFDAKKQQLMNM